MIGMGKKFISPPGYEGLTNNFKREIYQEKEYDRFGVRIDTGDIVLDAGGNVGIFTQYALDMGASKVYSYESDEETLNCYKENIKDDKVYPTLGVVGYNNFDLKKILDQHNLESINFAKIDIEGSEWDFFKNMDPSDMVKIDKWAIEFHTHYNGDFLEDSRKKEILWDFLQILEIFSKNGYKIFYENIHKGWDVVHLFAKR